MIRVAIIDDEADARELMRGLVTENCQPASIIWEAGGVAEGRECLLRECPDVLLLDIQLKDGSGFDLLQDLRMLENTAVVFVTAYDQFAVEAFRYSAAHYLLKPVSPLDLVTALERTRTIVRNRQLLATMTNLKEMHLSRKREKLVIHSVDGSTVVRLENLLYLSAEGGYTWLVTTEGERVLSTKKLGDFEEMLPEEDFFRIHHAHVVHLRFVKKVVKQDGDFAVMTNGDLVEISRRRKTEFLDRLSAY